MTLPLCEHILVSWCVQISSFHRDIYKFGLGPVFNLALFQLSHLYKGPILKYSHILWCCGFGPQCIHFEGHNSTPNNGGEYLEDIKLSFAVISYSLSVEDHFPSDNKIIVSWEEPF